MVDVIQAPEGQMQDIPTPPASSFKGIHEAVAPTTTPERFRSKQQTKKRTQKRARLIRSII